MYWKNSYLPRKKEEEHLVCVKDKNCTKYYNKHGLLHTNNPGQPAVIWANGDLEFWSNGELLETVEFVGDLANVKNFHKGKLTEDSWFTKSGICHNPFGPARHKIEDDYKCWMIMGVPHRVDGPAVIEKGRATWFYKGEEYKKEAYFKKLKKKDREAILFSEDFMKYS